MKRLNGNYRLLVINPGSTSTKLAVYENEVCVVEADYDIAGDGIKNCKTVFEQYDLRINSVRQFLQDNGITMEQIDGIASRGCGGGNQKAGAYEIDEAYIHLCRTNGIPHISNLSPILAYDFAKQYGKKAFVYDAEGVNEREPVTLLSGHPEIKMNSGSHTLNAKIVARKAAGRVGKEYTQATVIVCHMGGGVSSSCHKNGRMIDSSYDSYAPERVGGIPASASLNFVKLCYSGKYTEPQMKKLLMGQGGLAAYIGTSDLREVERRIRLGDREAEFYYDGMVLTLAKDIAAVSATVDMDVDVIALTGGMAKSEKLTEKLTEKVKRIAPVTVFPGSYEMENLATGVLRVMRGDEGCHRYGTDL